MQEIWKEVVGYEGKYQISNFGRVKSLSRIVYNQSGPYKIPERILSNKKSNGNGYKIVSLHKDGKGKNFYIHRLVAEHFIENPNNYNIINHKDENRSNNLFTNLEWCTNKYNVTYGNCRKKANETRHKNKKGFRPIRMYNAETMEFIKRYDSIRQCQRDINTNNQGIWSVLNGIQHKHKGYYFEYE